MKLGELKEATKPVKSLPKKFNSGDEFMDFVYDTWPSKETHVEHQGGGAWSAEIGGDDRIKAANYDEEDKVASWLDEDYEELEEATGKVIRTTNKFGNLQKAKEYAAKKKQESPKRYDFVVLKRKDKDQWEVYAEDAYLQWPMDHREPFELVWSTD